MHSSLIIHDWDLCALSLADLLRANGVEAIERRVSVDEWIELPPRRCPDLLVVRIECLGAYNLRSLRGRGLVPAGSRVVVLAEQCPRGLLSVLLADGVDGMINPAASADELGSAYQLIVDGGSASHAFDGGETEPQPDCHLTDREQQVGALLSSGQSKEIARALSIAPSTVKVHLVNLYRKLGVTDRKTAAGLVPNQIRTSPEPAACNQVT